MMKPIRAITIAGIIFSISLGFCSTQPSVDIKRGIIQKLLHGISVGDEKAVKEAIKQDSTLLEYKDPQHHNRRPIHLAVLNIKPNIVNFLIKAGADVNALDSYDGTALFWAVFSGRRPQVMADIITIIQLLLKAPNIAKSLATKEKSSMQTPLEFAQANNLTALVALLSGKPMQTPTSPTQLPPGFKK